MKTLRYILLISILLTPIAVHADNKGKEAGKEKSFISELLSFNGIGVSADVFGLAYSMLEDYTSYEFAVEANLGNRLYPIVEIGMGWCDATDETRGIKYKTSAPYYRVGFNYNLLTRRDKPNPKNYVYALARFGWSSFKYDIDAPAISDPVWGGEVPLILNDIDGSCSWAEIGIGIKVKIAKGFHMGWTVRYKARLSEKEGDNSRMWYVPGFGINKGTCFGGTYNLIYEIPLKKNRNK